jgi:hypothetical protein
MKKIYFETQQKLLTMILRSLYPFRKTLLQIDPVYSSVNEYMSISDKVSYCRCLMAETEDFLLASGNLMNDKTKDKYRAIIQAAKMEIEQLAEGDADPGNEVQYKNL